MAQPELILVFIACSDQGPVVRRPISANPGLNFNLGFYFSLFKSCLRIIFSIYFQSIQSKNWRQKDFSWIFFFKLSDLKSNFILILGYLNPALNNPAQEYYYSSLTVYPWMERSTEKVKVFTQEHSTMMPQGLEPQTSSSEFSLVTITPLHLWKINSHTVL